MRKLLSNNQANIGTIILAVATAITIAVSILIIYSVMGGMGSMTSLDSKVQKNCNYVLLGNSSKPVSNVTLALVVGLGTFFTLSPIYLVVLIAVAIIGAVMGIMVIRKQ